MTIIKELLELRGYTTLLVPHDFAREQLKKKFDTSYDPDPMRVQFKSAADLKAALKFLQGNDKWTQGKDYKVV